MIFRAVKYKQAAYLFILFLTFEGASQKYFFDNYSVADGLDQSKVYDILQDNNHFVWLGTQAGVSVFDGKKFDNKNQKDGLSPNGVRTLFKDSKGRIWMGHNGGGISLSVNNTIKQITSPDLIINGDVTSIIEDKYAKIWITTYNSGAFCLTEGKTQGEFTVKQFKGKSLSDWVFGSAMLKDSTLLFITDVGIKTFVEGSNYFQPYQIQGLSLFFQFIDIFQDSKLNVWFGTYNGGLYKYDYATKRFTYYKKDTGLADDWISCIKEDQNGNIWVGTWGGGISCFDTLGNITNFNTSNGLQDNKINSIVEDVEGNILIGTFEHGLSIFKGFHFVNFSKSDGLVSDQVTAIQQDNSGNIWFGTNGGLTKYNPAKGSFKSFSRPGHKISSDIRFLKTDFNNKLWIGTGEGVFSLKISNEAFEYDAIININLMPAQKKVEAMVIDRKNHLWIGTNDGLVEFDINNRYGKRYSHINGLCGNEIKALFIDRAENIWIGAMNKGVTIFDPAVPGFKCMENLADITPIAFTQDKLGRVWIASESDDVILYSNDSVLRRFNQDDGLLSTFIQTLDADENNVYLGSNRGLNIYKLDEDKIYTYTKRNGFSGIENKPNASLVDYKGNIWFGTVAGAMKFDPDAEKKSNMGPFTHIKSILINKEPRDIKPGVKLKHFENEITFNFYSICLNDPSSVQYQYMLEPLDKEWHQATEQTSAEYKPLVPGTYTFKVRARNNYGNWNKDPVTFSPLIIRPPFYRAFWFIALCIITGVVSIFSYIKIREQSLIKEKRILEETVQERTAELQEKKDQLETINKDITDSIHYAQRIQFAMLPPGPPFDDTFIFFRPKDIVSGDFYWFQQQGPMEFLSAVDCTGHGVPGAFMSFIGYNTLNKIVKEYGIFDPSEILGKLNEEVITTLRQTNKADDYANVKDGMDMALVSFNISGKKLEYSGAYNPLILIRKNEIIETKADRVAIGYDIKTKFTKHSLQIQDGDTIYMFSDGYADQFGGPARKKYKVAQLKRLLLSIQDKPMDEQRDILEKEHDTWKGGTEQIDDILVIGRRF